MNTRLLPLGVLLAGATLAHAAGPAVFDIRDFGAKGDGVTVNTRSIQKAVDACTAAGGGQVLVAGGKFVTGTIYLKSNLELHVVAGAVLLGSTNITDYAADTHKNMYAGEPHMDRCLLFARGATNLALTGHGTIDGQGRKENFPNPGDPAHLRPMLLRFLDCQHIRLRDLTLRNPAAWTSAWLYSRDIVVDGITIESRVNSNGDGLDFDGCEDVRVSNASFDTSDDSICLQASRANRPCRNITIQNCVMRSHWAGIRIGLLSAGDFENVAVSNCTFRDIEDAGLKIQMCEGGTMKNLVFSNLVMERVPRPVFVTFNSHRMGVDSPKDLPPMQALRDLQFSHIRVDNSGLGPATPTGIVVVGSTNHPIENIAFDDISLAMPGGGTAEQAAFREVSELQGRPEFGALGKVIPFAGLYTRHVRGLTVSNLRCDAARPEARPAILCEDTEDVDLSGLKAGPSFAGDAIIRLRRVGDAVIRQCRTQGASEFFLRLEDSADDAVDATSGNRHRSAKGMAITRGAP